jgi:hypothetical protein
MREQILAEADPEDLLEYIDDSYVCSGGDDFLVDIVPYKFEYIIDLISTDKTNQTE